MKIPQHTHVSLSMWCSALLLGWMAVLGAAHAGPIEQNTHPYPEAAQAVHEAEHAVDHAWETYHKAALGGTIASPARQAEIEEHLHDARRLVPRAQGAAERGDLREVDALVEQIKTHTNAAIVGSMEHKK